jgi:ABC-2 type transport system permease protein
MFIAISGQTIYRFDWLFGIFVEILNMAIRLIFWRAVLETSIHLGSYDMVKFINYFFVVSLVQKLSFTDIGYNVSDDIITGRLSFFLIKPLSYYKIKISNDLSGKFGNIVQLLAMAGIFVLLSLLLNTDFSIKVNFIVLLAILNGIILTFLMNYIIGLIGFWTKSVWALLLAYTVFARALGGQMFPLDIVPEGYRAFFVISPFYYATFFPVSLMMNSIDITGYYYINGIGIGILWILILILGCKILFTSGLKHYEATGI